MFIENAPNPDSVGKLLSEPTADQPACFTRQLTKYVNLSEKFVIKERTFKRQYAHIYANRLWMLR